MKKKIHIITDDNGYLCSSLITKAANNSVDVDSISSQLEKMNWTVEVSSYKDVCNGRKICDSFILYASSEDYGLFYKDYIEDNLMSILKDNNVLLPDIHFFRAHHNKVYMEMLRRTFKAEELRNNTLIFSGTEELREYVKKNTLVYPVVLKTSAGSGSAGVKCAANYKQLMAYAKTVTKCTYFDNYVTLYRTRPFQWMKNIYRKMRKQREVNYRKVQRKFIVQDYISNLSGDYKVLIFGDKYYVLYRDNRKNDFRASGSGYRTFPDMCEETEKILNYAKLAKNEIRQPFMSLDIAYDGKKCYLIEFQCISFGPYTLQMSEWYFVQKGNEWEKVCERTILEQAIVQAIDSFVEEYYL